MSPPCKSLPHLSHPHRSHASRLTVRRLAAAAVLLALSGTAAAAMGTDEERSACIPDAFRLCSSAIPDATRVIACLKTERIKLSPACRTVMKRNGTI